MGKTYLPMVVVNEPVVNITSLITYGADFILIYDIVFSNGLLGSKWHSTSDMEEFM